MAWRFSTIVPTLALAACAGKPTPVAVALAPPPVVATPAPPAPTPINAGLSSAATLWHLRTGLNVAALACRGPEAAALTGGYNTLLAKHAAALAAAAAAQQADYQLAGGDWRDRYDDDQTRLYNFWSQAHGREALCRAAAETLTALATLDDAGLTAMAGAQLAALDGALAPPRLMVDAAVFTGPGATLVASR